MSDHAFAAPVFHGEVILAPGAARLGGIGSQLQRSAAGARIECTHHAGGHVGAVVIINRRTNDRPDHRSPPEARSCDTTPADARPARGSRIQARRAIGPARHVQSQHTAGLSSHPVQSGAHRAWLRKCACGMAAVCERDGIQPCRDTAIDQPIAVIEAHVDLRIECPSLLAGRPDRARSRD